MKRRIISLALCLAMLVGMLPVLSRTPVHAATESQNNIVARADYLYNITWTAQSDVYGWNYESIFYAGNTYRIPYGQPINTGAYIGYYVSIEDFLTAANTAGSVFYTSRSSYDTTSSVYTTTVSGATCTEPGSEVSACSMCGLVNETAIPAAEHAYGDWSVTVQAT